MRGRETITEPAVVRKREEKEMTGRYFPDFVVRAKLGPGT
jgi:hypothetical protein